MFEDWRKVGTLPPGARIRAADGFRGTVLGTLANRTGGVGLLCDGCGPARICHNHMVQLPPHIMVLVVELPRNDG